MVRPDEKFQNPEAISEALSKMETPEQRYLKQIANALEGIEKELKKVNNGLRIKK